MIKTILLMVILSMSVSVFANDYTCSLRVGGSEGAEETSGIWKDRDLSLVLWLGTASFVIWKKPVLNEKKDVVGHVLNPYLYDSITKLHFAAEYLVGTKFLRVSTTGPNKSLTVGECVLDEAL